MRLDTELTARKLFSSRQKAKNAVVNGLIKVDGVVCTKPSFNVDENFSIEIAGDVLPYVGRGGLKLEKVIKKHNIRFDNMVCMDIGASTGGFTDCMLKNGADYVYAVDVGSDQLAESLKENKRVCNMEKTDIRNILPEDIGKKINFISVDVSFISLKLILPKTYEILDNSGKMVVLIKPQFEAGREKVGKKGVVRDPAVHREVIEMVTAYAQSISFAPCHLEFSPIKGPEGNIEYLLHLKKLPEGEHCEEVPFKIDEVVEAAHKELSSTTPHPAQKR